MDILLNNEIKCYVSSILIFSYLIFVEKWKRVYHFSF